MNFKKGTQVKVIAGKDKGKKGKGKGKGKKDRYDGGDRKWNHPNSTNWWEGTW